MCPAHKKGHNLNWKFEALLHENALRGCFAVKNHAGIWITLWVCYVTILQGTCKRKGTFQIKTFNGGQVDKVSKETEIPTHLPGDDECTGEVTICGGVGVVSGMEAFPGLAGAPLSFRWLQQDLCKDGMRLQGRCFQWLFAGA